MVQILRKVGAAEIMPNYRQLPAEDIRSKTAHDDLVTAADISAEQAIGREIRSLIQDIQIVGEEAVSDDARIRSYINTSDYVAIIDPIDGTWNYANGLPIFGTILAIVERGKTIFGVLYDPVCDDWIYALDGQGAYYQSAKGVQKPIRVGEGKDIENMTGIIPSFLFSKEQQLVLNSNMHHFNRIISLRCSCHEYRLLSEGKLDFGISGLIKPWDHAAGEFIYREAGGFAAMLESGEAYTPATTSGQLLVAPNKPTWEKLNVKFSRILS